MIPYPSSTLVNLSNIQSVIYSRSKIASYRSKLEEVCTRNILVNYHDDELIGDAINHIDNLPNPSNWSLLFFDYNLWVCHIPTTVSFPEVKSKKWPKKNLEFVKCDLCEALFKSCELVKEHFKNYECIVPTIFVCMNTDLELTNVQNVEVIDGLAEWE